MAVLPCGLENAADIWMMGNRVGPISVAIDVNVAQKNLLTIDTEIRCSHNTVSKVNEYSRLASRFRVDAVDNRTSKRPAGRDTINKYVV